MADTQTGAEGLRARKRRQTRERIVEAALRLFLANGYEATTLDAIAEAADISRRTFFSYFKSKDDVLLAWQEGANDALRAALIPAAHGRAPLDAVRRALAAIMSRYETADVIAIDDLMRSTEGLQARKQASYERQERALFSAMCEIWPEPERRSALRLVAMIGIGAFRLAFETWRDEDRTSPMTVYLDAAFERLRAEVHTEAAEGSVATT